MEGSIASPRNGTEDFGADGMTLWWLQPGWSDALCGFCGAKIAPDGDPDWGVCWPCKQRETRDSGGHHDEYGLCSRAPSGGWRP